MLESRYKHEAIAASFASQRWDVAWEKNEMVGVANSFAGESPDTWKFDKLYVHPRYQRNGIGHALLMEVKKHAAEASATRVVLRVNKRNTIALSAYAKYGFEIYDEHVLDIGHGYVMDDYLLELKPCS